MVWIDHLEYIPVILLKKTCAQVNLAGSDLFCLRSLQTVSNSVSLRSFPDQKWNGGYMPVGLWL